MNRTYLFDFDGTLVDSMPTFISVMLRILDEHGIKHPEGVVKTITPLGYLGTAEYFRTLGIKDTSESLVNTMKEYMKDEYENNILAKDSVVKTLIELSGRGASLNILTASPHSVLDPCLKRIGIFDLFENVWSCDDFETTKANPEIYRMAAERIGTEVGKIIFVDDNVGAIKTARLAGMKVYGIYDASSEAYVSEMKEAADAYIYKFCELLAI